MQLEGRVTKGNASEALIDLVDIVHSAEGFSAQQRGTVSLSSRLVHQRPRLHVLMMHFVSFTAFFLSCVMQNSQSFVGCMWGTADIPLAYASATMSMGGYSCRLGGGSPGKRMSSA